MRVPLYITALAAAIAILAAVCAVLFPPAPDELDIARRQFDTIREAAREQAAADAREALFKAERAKP